MLSKEKCIEMIKDFHEKKSLEIIPREQKIHFEQDLKRAISIIGPRRAGKTYEMFFIIDIIQQKWGKDKAVYMNWERADLENVSSIDLLTLLEAYYEIYPKNKNEKIWLFLDEIQNISGWEKAVRTFLDQNIGVFISGSSAKLLSKEIATSMRGRNISYAIYPFSFKEFLKGKRWEEKKVYSSKEKAECANLFQEYLLYGGYPEAVLFQKEREKILQDIYETAIFRDVIERGKIRNIKVLRLLIQSLLQAKEFSLNKFYNFTKSQGIKTSKNALYNYAEYLQDAYFIFFLRKHDLSYKKREQSHPKVYFIDTGLLTIHSIDDKGRLLENIVFLELIRREKDLAYYQNSLKEEIDFVVRKGKKVEQLIQVCYDTRDLMTKEREKRILLKASEECNCNELLILTISEEKEERVKGKKIVYLPVWKWLLQKERKSFPL